MPVVVITRRAGVVRSVDQCATCTAPAATGCRAERIGAAECRNRMFPLWQPFSKMFSELAPIGSAFLANLRPGGPGASIDDAWPTRIWSRRLAALGPPPNR